MCSSILTGTERRHVSLATLICEVVVDARCVLGSFQWYPSIERVCRGLYLINPAAFVSVLAIQPNSSRAISLCLHCCSILSTKKKSTKRTHRAGQPAFITLHPVADEYHLISISLQELKRLYLIELIPSSLYSPAWPPRVGGVRHSTGRDHHQELSEVSYRKLWAKRVGS